MVTHTEPDKPLTPNEKYEEAALELATYHLLLKDRNQATLPLDEADEKALEEQYWNSLPRYQKLIGKETLKQKSKEYWRREIVKILKTAAIIVLIMNFSLSIAAVSSNTVRTYLMEFFVRTNKRSTDIGFDITETFVDIPEDWTGKYYPAYIPEDYNLIQSISMKSMNAVLYMNSQEQILSFTVYSKDAKVNIDTEDMKLSNHNVHGIDAFMFSNESEATMVWPMGDEYIVLYMNDMTEDICMVAESVRVMEN